MTRSKRAPANAYAEPQTVFDEAKFQLLPYRP